MVEMAKAVGRPKDATRHQCRKLGIKYRDTHDRRGAPRSVWTEERLEWLREELKTKPVSQVAHESGFSYGSITGAVDDYGIPRMSRAEAVKSEWRRGRISATLQSKSDAQYPPDGPWVCVTCKESKPVSEFPVKHYNGHQCYTCQYKAHVERTYGIPYSTYEALYEAQDGKCAVCRAEETATHYGTGRVYMLSVDHDHSCCKGKKSCGKCVRGLLCRDCNHVLGKIEGRVDLQAFATYLLQ